MATTAAKNEPVEDAPGPRAHEDTWGAKADAKDKYAKAVAKDAEEKK